jgi:hypothetical protein
MNANTTATATFTATTYTITATAGAGGSISPSGSVSVAQGASRSFTITPNTGYQITGVTVDGSSVGAVTSYTFSNVTANHTISASFTAATTYTYTISATAEAGGTISPLGSVTVNQGASQSFTITPNTGYQVTDVLIDGTSVGAAMTYASISAAATYTFSNVTSNHNIVARFGRSRAGTYTITAIAGEGGNISPSGVITVNRGVNQSFTIVPNTGYRIEDVKVDGVSVCAVSTYTFTKVRSNHTIQVTFTVNTGNTFIITPIASVGGSISPACPVTVNQGANQTFTITPKRGYHVTDVKVDGLSVGVTSDVSINYTFMNVMTDHTINANFSRWR